MKQGESFEMVAITMQGLEELLADELKALGASDVEIGKRAVTFKGDQKVMYAANYHCRLALRILVPLVQMHIGGPQELYDAVYSIPWEEFIGPEQTIAIDTQMKSRLFRHSNFPSLKAKDAIVDRFRKNFKERPSVEKERPDLKVHLRIQKEILHISIDSSGESLNRRGYRESGFRAPLNEVLAAGLVKLSGWDRKVTLIDPMCGSGTILIEAGLMARNIPPGSLRDYFPFTSWKSFKPGLWKEVKSMHEDEGALTVPDIYGFDRDGRALRDARTNLRRAGLSAFIKLDQAAFGSNRPPAKKGLIIMNPPYGERIKTNDILTLYQKIGDTLKQDYPNFEAWILSSNKEALGKVGLRSKRKIPLFNGPLECRFTGFDLYEGKG